MIVVSLFNGMNTGRQALENLGFRVDKYYSSEIKPYAIKLTQHHFPDTIQVGDVRGWRNWDIDWSKVDFILSGSPCQDLSGAGNRAGITGVQSSLFYVFIEIYEHVKKLNPNVLFFQENVGSASKKDIGIMSRALGVYPCSICSSLVTAQLRDRYYWTNIKTKETFFDIVTDIPQPRDKGILLKDVIEHGYVDRDKSRAILESEERINTNMDLMYRRYKEKNFGNVVYQLNPSKESHNQQPFMQNRVYSDNGKIVCLTECQAFNLKTGFEYDGEFKVRPLTKVELCRLQGFPDNYCDILTRKEAASLLGDGWTLPVIEHIFSFINKNNCTNNQ